MPSYPPRTEPTKKDDQLNQRAKELQISILRQVDSGKIDKLADKYRLAQLSAIKAKIHSYYEKQFQNKATNTKLEKLERQMEEWKVKSRQDIIDKIKKSKLDR